MRIQHNIMAMNAYRNYNTNTSALSKNLEKLSSGYKINRAGDDAAGLAISEKMRAQITGLNAAQKNVKDGISLVKTAEGAMQEIQDMLNRMDYLATQSANGTYDNEVDRANLQKEVNQLLDEIDRIADSANFNGIKLLDGSLDTGTKSVDSNIPILQQAATDPTTEVGTKTVLRTPSTEVAKTSFTVELHDLEFTKSATETSLDVTIGDTSLTLDFSSENDGTVIDAEAIATAIKTAFEDTNQANGEIGGVAFTATVDGGSITFEQTNEPADSSELVNADLAVSITNPNASPATPGYVQTGATVTGPTTAAITATDGGGNAPTTISFNLAGTTVDKGGTFTFSIGDKAYEFEITDAEAADTTNITATIVQKVKAALDADPFVDEGGTAGGNGAGEFIAAVNNTTITLSTADDSTSSTWFDNNVTGTTLTIAEMAAADPTEASNGLTGTYNVETTVNSQGQLNKAGALASTKFNLTADMVKDGNVLTIGEAQYIFKTDAKSKVEAGDGQTLIDVSGYAAANQKNIAGELISREENSAFTVGYDKTAGTISIHEKEGQKVYDDELMSIEEFDKLVTLNSTVRNNADGKTLQLQIGDTSDTFNQLQVKVGDTHRTALGLNGLNISDAKNASTAIETIKAAINQVSSVRGDLGATQNRLEHTANNLSVMAENIQDAESTIRDTDVAEEMMAYTKNNILIQSAQAMLAQANAVPQGVLQLLG